jgi:hypothetical protein
MDSLFGIMCREALRGHVFGTGPLLLVDCMLSGMMGHRVHRLGEQYTAHVDKCNATRSAHMRELSSFLDYAFTEDRDLRRVIFAEEVRRVVFSAILRGGAASTAAALSLCHGFGTWVSSAPSRITEVFWGRRGAAGGGNAQLSEADVALLADAFIRSGLIARACALTHFKDCHCKQVEKNGRPLPAPFYDMLLRVPAALCRTESYVDMCSYNVTRDISFLVMLCRDGAITRAQLDRGCDEIMEGVFAGCETEGVSAPRWLDYIHKRTDTHVTQQLRSLVVSVAHQARI